MTLLDTWLQKNSACEPATGHLKGMQWDAWDKSDASKRADWVAWYRVQLLWDLEGDNKIDLTRFLLTDAVSIVKFLKQGGSYVNVDLIPSYSDIIINVQNVIDGADSQSIRILAEQAELNRRNYVHEKPNIFSAIKTLYMLPKIPVYGIKYILYLVNAGIKSIELSGLSKKQARETITNLFIPKADYIALYKRCPVNSRAGQISAYVKEGEVI